MKLTTKGEYSILALIYMARYGKEGFVKSEEICRKYNIPKKYLEQMFFVLKQSGYIKTKRGALGGYKLAKPANLISVAEIVRLMDGALAPTECVSTYFYSSTPLEQEKKITKKLREIRNYIAHELENLMISDLV